MTNPINRIAEYMGWEERHGEWYEDGTMCAMPDFLTPHGAWLVMDRFSAEMSRDEEYCYRDGAVSKVEEDEREWNALIQEDHSSYLGVSLNSITALTNAANAIIEQGEEKA